MLTQGGWRKFDLELLPKSWYIFSNIRQVRSGRHERRRWLIQQGRLESHLACRLPRPIGLTIRLQHRVFQGFIHIPQTHLIHAKFNNSPWETSLQTVVVEVGWGGDDVCVWVAVDSGSHLECSTIYCDNALSKLLLNATTTKGGSAQQWWNHSGKVALHDFQGKRVKVWKFCKINF